MTPLQEALADAVRELQRTQEAYLKAREKAEAVMAQMARGTAQDAPVSTIAPGAGGRVSPLSASEFGANGLMDFIVSPPRAHSCTLNNLRR